MANKNFEVKNGLTVGGTERISSAGVGTFTDLNVTGTTTTIDTANLQVKDKNIVLNYGTGDTSSTANGSGITIQDAVNSSTDATINWSQAAGSFEFSRSIDVTGGITSSANLSIGGTTTLTGNIGVKVPSLVSFRTNSNEAAIQYGKRGVLFSDTGLTTDIANNTYVTSSNTRNAIEADLGSYYQQYQGVHKWVNAPSVSAGAQQTFSERMRINANGNVGIGHDNPASGLHLKGGDNTSSKLTLTNSAPTPDNTWSLHPIYNGQDLYLAEDGTTRISFIAGGNVDVKSGNIYLTGNNDRRIKLSDSGVAGITDSNNTVHIRGDNDYMKLNAAGNGGFIWEENGTERMRIDSSGRVTVGTSLDADGAAVIPAGVFHTKRYGYHAGQRTHSGETFAYCESTGWVDALKIDWNNPSWGAVCLRITGQYYHSASDNFSIVIAFAGYSGATSISYDATSNGVMNWTSAIQLSQPATGETLIKQRAGSTVGDVVYRYEWQTYNRSDQEIDIIDY